MNNSPMVVDKI